jgi:type III restriction enzyme
MQLKVYQQRALDVLSGFLTDCRPDGSIREASACAQAIDTHPHIKHWIRNIPKDSQSFRLPVATGWFYPDFVCELIEGRILVVEYKGKPLVTNDESKEKHQVGLQWAKSSGGQCVFIMAEKQDAQGRDVKTQISALLERTP